eukprot:EC823893.1.p1 GENE.EC823893.1~~EC823893.1.p1  ORF type:complete len:218 (+),score=91.23 EC823893.1:24-677(+)
MSGEEENLKTLKILLIGNSGVGKSCLLLRFCDPNYKFSNTFVSTIGIDFRLKTVEVNNQKINLQIWDTAGQERFQTITRKYYQGAHGIILVFDVTDKNSLDSVKHWMKSIEENSKEAVKVNLVGNKCDLRDSQPENTSYVSNKQGKQMADDCKLNYFETSAKTGAGINECFQNLAQSILSQKSENSEEEEKKETKIVDIEKDNKNKEGGKKGCCSLI